MYLSHKGPVRFHFHFTATGCRDFEVPTQYAIRHNGNSAIVTCKATGSHWLMTCEDNQWKGDIGNCTAGK